MNFWQNSNTLSYGLRLCVCTYKPKFGIKEYSGIIYIRDSLELTQMLAFDWTW